MSAQDIDDEAEAKRSGFRITLHWIKQQVIYEGYFTLDTVIPDRNVSLRVAEALKVMTICVLVANNGWVVIGKTAAVDPANFDAELGKKFAYDDAIRQFWPLWAFAHKEVQYKLDYIKSQNEAGNI